MRNLYFQCQIRYYNIVRDYWNDNELPVFYCGRKLTGESQSAETEERTRPRSVINLHQLYLPSISIFLLVLQVDIICVYINVCKQS